MEKVSKPSSEDVERFLPLEDAARIAGCSHWTLRLWAKNGKIRHERSGLRGVILIPVSEVAKIRQLSGRRAQQVDKSWLEEKLLALDVDAQLVAVIVRAFEKVMEAKMSAPPDGGDGRGMK